MFSERVRTLIQNCIHCYDSVSAHAAQRGRFCVVHSYDIRRAVRMCTRTNENNMRILMSMFYFEPNGSEHAWKSKCKCNDQYAYYLYRSHIRVGVHQIFKYLWRLRMRTSIDSTKSNQIGEKIHSDWPSFVNCQYTCSTVCVFYFLSKYMSDLVKKWQHN